MVDLTQFREQVTIFRKRKRNADGRQYTLEALGKAIGLTADELGHRLRGNGHVSLTQENVLAIVRTLAEWETLTWDESVELLIWMEYPLDPPDWQKDLQRFLGLPPRSVHQAIASRVASPGGEPSSPVRHRLFQARNLPKDYVPRPNAFDEIKHLLLTHEDNQTTAITTALRGAGGFGKTTLALALCHDPEIQAAFPDGILWVELGEHPSGSLAVQNELLHVLEPAGREALTLEEARERWRGALEKRSCLLVIDDVWQTEAMEELLQGGPRCGRLITTRNDQLLPEATKRVWVDAMEPAEAMALLCEGVIDEWQHTLGQSVLEQVVVQQLGCWPLLVSLARGMLKNQVGRLHKAPKQALALLKQAYEERGMATFHLGDRDERQRNVDACLEVNLRQLEAWVPAHYQARQRYLELAVFPEDTNIPLSTFQIYWKGAGGLLKWEVEDLCLRLADLSLLLPWSMEHSTIRLHDVLRSYLIQRVGNQLPALHQRLLDDQQQHYHLTGWADLPQSETYLWKYLVFHLCQANDQEALQTTLTDLMYVARAVQYRGVTALEVDLVVVTTALNGEGAHFLAAYLAPLQRRIREFHHLLQQVSSNAEVGGLLLSALHKEEVWLAQRQQFEQVVPRPFLTIWLSWPHTASDTLFRTFVGHTGSVDACGYSPDGQWIVSASRDQTLKVWEAAAGVEVRTLRGHTHFVCACGYSPDGKWIVSGSEDGMLKVWEAAAGTEICTFRGHTWVISACAFSPDGKWIVSASCDSTLKVWEAATGVELHTFREHIREVTACGYSPDGKWIVSASHDRTLKVWNATTGVERLTLRGHTGGVTACGYSPDGKWIVSASWDKTLKVWEAATGAEVRTLRGHTDLVSACEYSPDSKWIVSASYDKTLKVWEAATGAEVRTLRGHTDSVHDCEYSPDSKWIVSASYDKTLKVWNAATGAELHPFREHANTGAELHPFWEHINVVRSGALSPDGKWVVSGSRDGTLKVWDATTGAEHFTLAGHTGWVEACGYSPDGKWIVSGSRDHTLKVWEAATGAEVHTLSGHTEGVTACRYSPDGKWIVSASEDWSLKVWEAATGAEVHALRGHGCPVWACAFSPDGKWIVSGSHNHRLKVWETATGAELRTLSGHTDIVWACGYSPDGTKIVSASGDQTLKVWDAATGAEDLTLCGHTSRVNDCGYSPDGQWIVSVSFDHTLKVWEVQRGQCVLTYPVDGDLWGCAFFSDGKHLMAWGDGGIYLLSLVM